jgi:CRISPR-associated exonuclease Cas4
MLYLALGLLALALFFFWQAARQKKSAGLPGGRVVYSDASHWGPVEKPLYDPVIGLTGKPDYLVEGEDGTIPVEVKSARADEPFDSHIFQLAAYCRLTETLTGRRPPYGLIHYTNQTFQIEYTPALEEALLDVIVEMQAHPPKAPLPRSHDQRARCARCGYRHTCDQRLG